MAVNYGYGKTAGTDALVFTYDTGDIRNSYRGEPTVNLSYNNGQGGSEYLAAPITWVNAGSWDYNGDATDVPKPEVVGVNTAGLKVMSGTNTTAGGSVHFGCGYTPVSPSTTYTVSVWYRQNRAGASQPYLRTNITNVGLANLAYNGDTNSANWPVDQWIRVSATGTTASNENGIYISNYIGTYVGDKIWYFAHQVEQKSHVTPLVTGTRSATQGLLDLTGNSSVDLSNVSFDSNAQIIFDGTDDYISLPSASWNILTTHTLEVVFKANGTPANGYHVMFQKEGGYSGGSVYGLRANPGGSLLAMICYDAQAASQNTLGGGTLVNGQWYHVTATFDSNYNWKLYINGTLANSTTLTGNPYQNSSSISIGQGDGRKTNGTLPVMKIYNRALTASEVASNYNHYKSRFNIS